MKHYVITIVLLLALMFILLRKKEISRIEMIDYLNAEVGNVNGVWVNMSDEDIRQVYKVFKLIKQGVKPSQSDYLKAHDLAVKYKISTLFQ